MEGVAVNYDSFLGQKNQFFVAQGHLQMVGICKPSIGLESKIFFANEKNMNAHEIYEEKKTNKNLFVDCASSYCCKHIF